MTNPEQHALPQEPQQMNVTQACAPDDALLIAWNKYKESEEFANSRNWAKHEAYVDGSMWAAFMQGYLAAVQEAKTVLPEEVETLVKHLRAPAYWLSGSEDQHEGDNDAPIKAAALLEAQQEQIDARKQDIDKWKADYLTLQESDFALSRRVEAAETMAVALEEIATMKPSPIGDSGFEHGPALLLSNCQRIAQKSFAVFRKTGETG